MCTRWLSSVYSDTERPRTVGTLYLCDSKLWGIKNHLRKLGTFTIDGHAFGATGIIKNLHGDIKGYYRDDACYGYDPMDDRLYELTEPIAWNILSAFRGGIYIGRSQKTLIGLYKGGAEGAIAAFHCLVAIRYCYPLTDDCWRVSLDAFDEMDERYK